MQTGRQTDAGDFQRGFAVDAEMTPAEFTGAVHPEKTDQNQNGRQNLRDYSGQCHASDVHMEADDENEVQYDVQGAGNEQKVERTLRVADGTENGGTEIVEHIGRHTVENDAHIKLRQIDDVCRRLHPLQQRAGDQ